MPPTLRKLVPALLFTLVVFLSLPASTPAPCQDQLCAWNGSDCWQCGSGAGFGCSTSECSRCTNSKCQEEVTYLRLPDGKVQRVALTSCRSESGYSDARLISATFHQPSGGSDPQRTNTIFSIARQPEDPATLMSTTHSSTDLLSAAVIKNRGTKRMVSYRIAWEVHFPGGGKPQTGLGEWMNVPAGIEPEKTSQVQAQAVSIDPVKKGAARIEFAVGAVRFADGTTWQRK
jgi:hypothetical protein